jgi:glycerol-3-phosphate acyltransferase PlsY
VGSYLLGSTAFGLLLGLFVRGIDIRKHGSGNAGATNAGRVLGRPFGLIAFAGDFLKGWAASAWLGPLGTSLPEREPLLAAWCGAAAVIGHVWPVFFGFRGGKAVATGCGAVLGMDPLTFAVGGLAWLAVAATSRMVSLASLAMCFAFPVFAWWRWKFKDGGPELVWVTLALALLVLWRHRANIERILAGKEPRLGPGASRTGSKEP